MCQLLNVRNVFCWSDSQISLWWVRQVWKDCKVWIENRVQVIRKNMAPKYWTYVPTDINLADKTTRLFSPNTFVSCELCWKGTDFFNLKILICHVRVFWDREKFLKNRRQRQCCLQIVKEPLALENWWIIVGLDRHRNYFVSLVISGGLWRIWR